MNDFWNGFHEATNTIVAILLNRTTWLYVLTVVAFCAATAGIMYLFWWVRKTLREGLPQARWKCRAFSLVRWLVLTPLWFVVSVGVLNGVFHDLENSACLVLAIFAVYGFFCAINARIDVLEERRKAERAAGRFPT